MNATALEFMGMGALIAVLGVPLYARKIPPNWLYGLRISATLKNSWVWYEANARSGRDMIWCGVIVAITAVCLSLVGLPSKTYSIACTGVILALLLALTIRGVIGANRLRDSLPESERSTEPQR